MRQANVLTRVIRLGVCLVLAAQAFAPREAPGAEGTDLDTQLMLGTVKVSDPDSTGTAFILSRTDPDNPKGTQFLLVTAEHVLGRTKGDEVSVVFHKRDAEGGYAKSPSKVKVRKSGKPLWTKHPTVDVAVMPITPPADAFTPSLAIDLLASDVDLARYEIHPGDIFRCIGYPHPNLFESGDSGFGVVRSGCIASYPLLPTRKSKSFLGDFNIFEGDSGAPVYLAENARVYGAKPETGRVRLILGLVSGQHFIDEEFKMIYQNGKFRHRMGLGIIMHASAIKEAIDLLNPAKEAQAKQP